jgi:hypothetical protein
MPEAAPLDSPAASAKEAGATEDRRLPPSGVTPAPATVVLSPAWHPHARVSIDGSRDLQLDRPRTLKLPPGKHMLVFDLVTGDYHMAQTTALLLRAGETHKVACPLPPPGQLTVRQGLGSPRGWIRIGEETLGWSPIQQREMAPGTYELAISAEGPSGSGTADEKVVTIVTLRANREIIVTFDLNGGLPPTISEKGLDRP